LSLRTSFSTVRRTTQRLCEMEIVIASTIVPFIEGGGTFIVDWLEQILIERGHSVFTFKIPFSSNVEEMADQMIGLRLLDLRGCGERLIAIRTPSYLLRHPNKILWFIHHYRTAYDLWNTSYCEFPKTKEGLAQRNWIFSSDMLAFHEARRIFTNSQVVSKRLMQYNNIASEVLYPPLLRPERYTCRSYGETIVYISRVVGHKRQHLAVESMRYTQTAVKLLIAGQTENADVRQTILDLIERHELQDKVAFLDAWISEERKQKLLADCLACIYIPFDEDSYGYSTLEAFHSLKPIITTDDSGGTLELIEDGQNGIVTPPSPQAIARAMDTLYHDRERARQLGMAGRRRIEELGIDWDRVVEKLLQ
jgi:glycosyltransferase involved in cell wall biosynthesis